MNPFSKRLPRPDLLLVMHGTSRQAMQLIVEKETEIEIKGDKMISLIFKEPYIIAEVGFEPTTFCL